MLNNIIIIISGWYIYHFMEYLFHYIGHSRKYGGHIYTLHMNHHKIHYPINKLIDYAPYKTGNIYYISEGFVAYVPPSILIFIGLYNILSQYNFILILLEFSIIGIISDYIHTNLHIRDSWLERYKWFLERRRLHLIHHKKLNTNYSVIDFSIDKLARTYND